MTLPLISQRKSKPSGGIPHLSTLTHHPSTSTLAFLPPPCPKARPLCLALVPLPLPFSGTSLPQSPLYPTLPASSPLLNNSSQHPSVSQYFLSLKHLLLPSAIPVCPLSVPSFFQGSSTSELPCSSSVPPPQTFPLLPCPTLKTCRHPTLMLSLWLQQHPTCLPRPCQNGLPLASSVSHDPDFSPAPLTLLLGPSASSTFSLQLESFLAHDFLGVITPSFLMPSIPGQVLSRLPCCVSPLRHSLISRASSHVQTPIFHLNLYHDDLTPALLPLAQGVTFEIVDPSGHCPAQTPGGWL